MFVYTQPSHLRMRYVGAVFLNIREYYDAGSGDLRPGKKGISLSAEQVCSPLVKCPGSMLMSTAVERPQGQR